MPDFERGDRQGIPILNKAQMKLHLRVDLSDEESLIDTMLDAAVREVEDYAQIALVDQTITATFTGPFPAGRMYLPVGPVLSTTGATSTLVEQDGTETALTAAQFRLTTGRAPAIWIIEGVSQPAAMKQDSSTLRVAYTAGFGPEAADVPPDLRHALLDQVAALYEHRAGAVMPRHVQSMSSNTQRIAQRYRRVGI
ncbi:MAG: head-tail connector protein [Dinoroseobacter sp.]|nr:head-tail connector protein [Dinoroseobacter sp.]